MSKPEPLKILSYADMKDLPEPAWLIDGLIQENTTALMFGKSNSFKSFLAIDIALSVASHRPWHSH
ncbi:AAA family ATPase, partial [Mesorhizobium sp. M00.F.Ca.ET.216.01.1.1]